MSLEADQVVDRRRLKRRLIFWRVMAIAALVGLVVVAVGRFSGLHERAYVARLKIDSIILDDPLRGEAIARLAKDTNVRALMVRIDSPGGTVVGGESLFASLRAVAEKKPVVAILGEIATSAAYMTALGADHIIAHPGTLTGSIGVILQSADITGLLTKLGIKPQIVKSRPLKAQPNPLESFTPAARAAARAVVLDLFDLFVDMVVARRNLPPAKVMKLADGRVFSGRQALANGLIDQLGSEADARQWLAATHGVAASLGVKDVEIGPDVPYWRGFLDDVVGKALFSERLSLDGLVSLWHPNGW